MPGCRHRHAILSVSHIDSASADTPSDEDVLQYDTDDSLWHPTALPSPGPTNFLGLTDTPSAFTGHGLKEVRVNVAANALEFTDQYAAAHTWAALQSFSAGIQITDGQAIKDSGGTDRFKLFDGAYISLLDSTLQIGSPSWKFGALALNGAPLGADAIVNILAPSSSDLPLNNPILLRLNCLQPFTLSGNNRLARVIEGSPFVGFAAGTTNWGLLGMDFRPRASPGAGTTLATIAALSGLPGIGGAGAASLMAGLYLPSPYITLTPTITDLVGVDIEDYGLSAAATATGLRIANITAGTLRHLLNAYGLTSSNIRADAGDPAANQSQVHIAVNNGAVVLRRIEIGAINTGGAGYRMLRVLN